MGEQRDKRREEALRRREREGVVLQPCSSCPGEVYTKVPAKGSMGSQSGAVTPEEEARWEEVPVPATNGKSGEPARYNPPNPRLTVVETVYYQPGAHGVEDFVESRYSVLLHKDDQPYKRKLKIEKGETWQPLDTGWIREVSLLHIENSGKGVLRLSFSSDLPTCMILMPRESLRLRPAQPLFVSSLEEETWITVTAFPS